VIFLFFLGILLITPLSVVLFLISPSLPVFYLLISFTLIVVLLIFGSLIRHKIVVKGLSPVRGMLTTVGVIFLFSFGIHAISNFVTGRELNTTIQQVRAEGIKLTPREVIPPLVLDKDNAALIYKQAFDLADKLLPKYKKEWDYMWSYGGLFPTVKLSPLQKNKISGIIREPEFIKLYALIEKAVSLPSYRSDIRYEDGPSALMPHLANMRGLARLIATRTYILTWEGRYGEALESAKTGLRLGDSLTNEPIIISQLVRTAVDDIATNSFRQLLNSFSSTISTKDYQYLISEINKKNKYFTKSLEAELAIMGNWIFSNGGRALAGTDFTVQHKDFNFKINLGNILVITYRNYLGGPLRKNDNAFYIHSLTTLIGLSQKPFFQVKNVVAQWNRNMGTSLITNGKHIISTMLLPAQSGLLKQQAKYAANLESFKLALALKIYKQKHGYYPDKLFSLSPEIIPELSLDPFTGKDYIYRKEGRGFILYSVGLNEKDDNGVYDPKQKYDDIAWKVLN
jgi:hypothetical protein